jgi:hypothetical protein
MKVRADALLAGDILEFTAITASGQQIDGVPVALLVKTRTYIEVTVTYPADGSTRYQRFAPGDLVEIHDRSAS